MSKEGVDISKLAPHTQLVVETLNCIYTIEILDSETAAVQITGGATFTESTKAFIEGSSHKGETFEKWLNKEMSMVIRYKKEKHRKFHTVESDAIQTIKLIGPDNKWSYTI